MIMILLILDIFLILFILFLMIIFMIMWFLVDVFSFYKCQEVFSEYVGGYSCMDIVMDSLVGDELLFNSEFLIWNQFNEDQGNCVQLKLKQMLLVVVMVFFVMNFFSYVICVQFFVCFLVDFIYRIDVVEVFWQQLF